jgi:hypothetical protein
MIPLSHGQSSGELSRQVVQAMLRVMQRKQGELINAARKEWECKFAGSDPSDACVSVRIGAGSASSDFSRMFPLPSSRGLNLC